MIKKLRRQFVLVIMIIVAVMLSAILGLFFFAAKWNYEKESITMMERVASPSFKAGLSGFRPGGANMPLPYFTLTVDAFGNFTAGGNGYYDLSDEDLLSSMLEDVRAKDDDTGVLRDYNLRYFIHSDVLSTTIVFMDMSAENSALEAMARTCLFIFVAAMLVFLGISCLLSYWVIKPVDKAWQQQKQFVADASHELKTPLTVIMTNAELLQTADEDGENKEQLAANILTVSQQMRGLVESLLELARADNGSSKAVMSTVDFSKLTEEALLPFEPVFFEDGERTIESELSPGITLTGDASHLRQIVEILLDNARKYSYPATTTTVKLVRRSHSCELSVADRGEPISSEDLSNIFKRFYRADKVRTMSKSYGLGLSIAQCFVNEHKGKIRAESKDGINTFYVTLPCNS